MDRKSFACRKGLQRRQKFQKGFNLDNFWKLYLTRIWFFLQLIFEMWYFSCGSLLKYDFFFPFHFIGWLFLPPGGKKTHHFVTNQQNSYSFWKRLLNLFLILLASKIGYFVAVFLYKFFFHLFVEIGKLSDRIFFLN